MVFKGISEKGRIKYDSSGVNIINNEGSAINLWTKANRRMTIDSSGLLGLGTTAPNALLDVRGDAVFNEDGLDKDFKIEGDTDQLLFYANAGTDRIGIGTNAPTKKLHVGGEARVDGMLDVNGDFRCESLIVLEHSGGGGQSTFQGSGSDLLIYNIGHTYIGGGTLYGLSIKSDKVGIGGYFTPTSTLDVRGDAVFNEDGGDNDFRIEGSSNSSAFFVDASTNNVGINLGGYSPQATLSVNGDAVFNSMGHDNDFTIEGDTNPSLFVVDASADKIGIGKLTPTSLLDIYNDTGQGLMRVQNNTGTKMRIYSNGTMSVGYNAGSGVTRALQLNNSTVDTIGRARANAWHTYSDKRIKSQIRDLNGALDKILLLKPKTYFHHSTEVDSSGALINFKSQLGEHTIGFIAQEVYENIPEAVTKPKDESTDLWSMDYDKLIPVLVKAVQEQQDIINDLTQKLEETKHNILLIQQERNQK